MKVPEMKVITQRSASNNDLYKKDESFFDPTNGDSKLHPMHHIILAEHFKNMVISKICNLFDDTNAVRSLIQSLNSLALNHIYEAVYMAWFECGTGDASYAYTASDVLCESICVVLHEQFPLSAIDNNRNAILNIIYDSLPIKIIFKD